MTIEARLGSRVPVGQRVIVNVLGGTVRGPRLKGEIVAPAGDWVLAMTDGSSRLDVRFTIKTDDGEFVFVEYSGISAPTKETQGSLVKGEAVTAADGYGYFIITPRFMTASAKYAWFVNASASSKYGDFALIAEHPGQDHRLPRRVTQYRNRAEQEP